MKRFYLPALCAAIAASASAAADYTSGIYLLNEGSWGAYGTLSHLDTATGTWTYNAFASANEGHTLGMTGTTATIHGGSIYMMAKEAKADNQAILTKADAETLKLQAATSALGFEGCQGRSFIALDDETGYVTTDKGVAAVKLADLSLITTIAGIKGDDDAAEVECGNMALVDGLVYTATYSRYLYVIEADSNTVKYTADLATVTGNDQAKCGSVAATADGSVWASVAADYNGTTLPYLVQLTATADKLDAKVIDIPAGVYAPANSWYAWTPDGFCASEATGTLYWNGGASSFTSNKTIYSYDTATGTFGTFYEFADDQFLYSGAMRVNPADGCLYAAYVTGENAWTDNFTLGRVDADGKMETTYPMEQGYWYPSQPVFIQQASAGISAPAISDTDAVSASRRGNAIIVKGTGTAMLYTLSGALVSVTEVDGEAVIDAPATLAILRVGDKAFKL